jgi:hypothetical protein
VRWLAIAVTGAESVLNRAELTNLIAGRLLTFAAQLLVGFPNHAGELCEFFHVKVEGGLEGIDDDLVFAFVMPDRSKVAFTKGLKVINVHGSSKNAVSAFLKSKPFASPFRKVRDLPSLVS